MRLTIINEVRIMDKEAIKRALLKISHEILARNNGPENLVLIGLRTRGVFIAERIASMIKGIENATIPVGILDVTMPKNLINSLYQQIIERFSWTFPFLKQLIKLLQ